MNKVMKVLALAIISIAMVGSMSAQDKTSAMAKGKKVYEEYCKTCHQSNGQGLGTAFPPLAKSDYLKNTPRATVIKEVINGKSGKVKVNGKEYNGVMAPLPAKYTAEDIANVMTYVYNSWGNSAPVVTVAEVKKIAPKRK